jgi:hypothetical protein
LLLATSCRRAAQQAAIHKSNQQQLASKAAEAEKARQEDAAFRAAWGERLVALKAEEQQERRQAREAAQQVQRFQEWQAAQRKKKEAAAKLDVVQASLMAQAAVEEQEATFQAYASALLEETQRKRLPTKPLELYMYRKEEDIKATM